MVPYPTRHWGRIAAGVDQDTLEVEVAQTSEEEQAYGAVAVEVENADGGMGDRD